MLNDIVLISLMLFAYWYWHQAQQFKIMALSATKARCAALELLMLDDYVALTRMGLAKDTAGHWRIYRCYSFEFASTGEDRYRGMCRLLGHRVQSITMEPYRTELSGF